MAICKYCKREMLTDDGCTFAHVKIDDKIYDRVPVGGNKYDFYFDKPDGICGDCGAHYGHFHHPGCDIEISPVDGGQLLFNCEEYLE